MEKERPYGQLCKELSKNQVTNNHKDMICPVCGYPHLSEHIYVEEGIGELCPCCFFEFGVDEFRGITFQSFRENWIEQGLPFMSGDFGTNWDVHSALSQLDNLAQVSPALFSKQIKEVNSEWSIEFSRNLVIERFGK